MFSRTNLMALFGIAFGLGILSLRADGSGITRNYRTRFRDKEISDIRTRPENALQTGESCELDSEAREWMDRTDKELGRRYGVVSLADWDYFTNMTEENSRKDLLVAKEVDEWMANQTEVAKGFLAKSDKICNETTLRQLRLFTYFNTEPPCKNQTTRRKINQLINEMQEIFSTTKATRDGRTDRLHPELYTIMMKSRDYNELLWAWGAWHNTSGRKLKPLYVELVDKMNECAQDNGYSDIGIYWQYFDYDQANIESEMDRLYEEVLPFYEQLHSYVRKKLSKHYPNIDSTGFIPEHLLGNRMAKTWESSDDILLPFPNAFSNYGVTKVMVDQGYTANRMFRLAEEFFVSIGLESMTSDFWNKSIIVRPDDNRPMDCHASSFDFFDQTDFRIKMCTQVNSIDLQKIHHEMGHIEYFMLYRQQPTVFRMGANAALHEAIGDTIALSVMTDTHLSVIGLISANNESSPAELYEQEINHLMRMALSKIGFIPFGYNIEKWRFMVFRGDITPDNYTSGWWKLREYYAGITSPVPRLNIDFDPGAIYHIPANVPYSRYFFSYFGQFQFHSTLCKLADHKGPLHKCDIYQSKEAGKRLRSVLSLGASRPWPEVLEKFTGSKRFEVDGILEYFQPLIDWLKIENKDNDVGWRKRGSS